MVQAIEGRQVAEDSDCGNVRDSSWELYKCTGAQRATKEPLAVGSN